MTLPFTRTSKEPAKVFVSLLLQPAVAPEVPGVSPEKSMETRFFAPGNLVSNLDFVESIFGNGGDPFLPDNDARLGAEHWSGHTSCVILAPHLVSLKKKDLGLPNVADATERQQRDGKLIEASRLGYRFTEAKATLAHVNSPAYRESLVGMIGADPALV